MGGSNSGRWGGRPTVNGVMALDLRKLLKDGCLRPGEDQGGVLTWARSGSNDAVATIGFEVRFNASDRGQMRLQYTSTQGADRTDHDYPIDLATTPQPFGGRRWWFVCPKTGARTLKLYLPRGAIRFASRQAYRLAYPSQRASARDRATNRMFKLRERLGDDGGLGSPIQKPPRMRWERFDRERAKIDAVERVCLGNMAAFVDKLRRQSQRR